MEMSRKLEKKIKKYPLSATVLILTENGEHIEGTVGEWFRWAEEYKWKIKSFRLLCEICCNPERVAKYDKITNFTKCNICDLNEYYEALNKYFDKVAKSKCKTCKEPPEYDEDGMLWNSCIKHF
jgi:hypothetical protein